MLRKSLSFPFFKTVVRDTEFYTFCPTIPLHLPYPFNSWPFKGVHLYKLEGRLDWGYNLTDSLCWYAGEQGWHLEAYGLGTIPLDPWALLDRIGKLSLQWHHRLVSWPRCSDGGNRPCRPIISNSHIPFPTYNFGSWNLFSFPWLITHIVPHLESLPSSHPVRAFRSLQVTFHDRVALTGLCLLWVSAKPASYIAIQHIFSLTSW